MFESTRSTASRPTKGRRPSLIFSEDARSCFVYHFMFGPKYKTGCPSCSAIADGFNGIAVHPANHDVMLSGGVASSTREARLVGVAAIVAGVTTTTYKLNQ